MRSSSCRCDILVARSLRDEFDLPLGRVLHGSRFIEQRDVQVLLVNTEVRPFTLEQLPPVTRRAPLFSGLIPWPFSCRSIRLPE